jgi:hypothetical protein
LLILKWIDIIKAASGQDRRQFIHDSFWSEHPLFNVWRCIFEHSFYLKTDPTSNDKSQLDRIIIEFHVINSDFVC